MLAIRTMVRDPSEFYSRPMIVLFELAEVMGCRFFRNYNAARLG